MHLHKGLNLQVNVVEKYCAPDKSYNYVDNIQGLQTEQRKVIPELENPSCLQATFESTVDQ